MALGVSDGVVRAVLPALLGVGAAFAFLRRARREHVEAVPPEAIARFFLLLALPLGGLLIAAVGAFLAIGAPDAAGVALSALGAAALLQAVLQGILGARALPRVLQDATAVGPALVPLALAEIPTAGALVWVVLAVGGA